MLMPQAAKSLIWWRPRPELNWCTRFCRPLRNHSATWPHGRGSIYSINGLGNRPSSVECQASIQRRDWLPPCAAPAHGVASVAGWLAVELEGARSAGCPGGSRARAILTRQPYCEVEIVPSLHSNLAGAASATGAVFSGAAACCWGAGASAADFSDKAQPAHQREINTATPIRIWVASRPLRGPLRMAVCDDQPAAREVTSAYNGHA
jgi:hypothetical protein